MSFVSMLGLPFFAVILSGKVLPSGMTSAGVACIQTEVSATFCVHKFAFIFIIPAD